MPISPCHERPDKPKLVRRSPVKEPSGSSEKVPVGQIKGLSADFFLVEATVTLGLAFPWMTLVFDSRPSVVSDFTGVLVTTWAWTVGIEVAFGFVPGGMSGLAEEVTGKGGSTVL
jgi:hypothetical protein